jgi:hypothetical protein
MNAYYMQISQVLTDSVSLSLPPIAISFASQMPEGIRKLDGPRSGRLPLLVGGGKRGVCDGSDRS